MRWLALALTLSSCAGGRTFYVDSRFTPEEEQQIQAASDAWAEATYGALQLNLVFGARVDVWEQDRNTIIKTNNRGASYRYPDMVDDGSAAFAHNQNGPFDADMIVFLSGSHHMSVQGIMTHEMGHIFGLQHVANPRAVMYWEATSECITRYDLTEAHRVNRFTLDKACDEE